MLRERQTSLTRLQFFYVSLQNLRLLDISVESRNSFYKNEIIACVNVLSHTKIPADYGLLKRSVGFNTFSGCDELNVSGDSRSTWYMKHGLTHCVVPFDVRFDSPVRGRSFDHFDPSWELREKLTTARTNQHLKPPKENVLLTVTNFSTIPRFTSEHSTIVEQFPRVRPASVVRGDSSAYWQTRGSSATSRSRSRVRRSPEHERFTSIDTTTIMITGVWSSNGLSSTRRANERAKEAALAAWDVRADDAS